MTKQIITIGNKTYSITEIENPIKESKQKTKQYSGALYKPTYGEDFYDVYQNRLIGCFITAHNYNEQAPQPKNVFKTESHAQQYADALNTINELRETSVLPEENGAEQYFIQWIDGDGYFINTADTFTEKIFNFSPMFSSKQEARDAINRVGEERIVKAAKVMKGIYNES